MHTDGYLTGFLAIISQSLREGIDPRNGGGPKYDLRPPKHIRGSSFAAGALTASAGGTSLLVPASNTNGAIIRTIFGYPPGSTNVFAVYCDTAGPASATDATKNCVFNGANTFVIPPPLPIYIPSGIGIYAISNAAGGFFHISWDLL